MSTELIKPFSDIYTDYLRDESGFTGTATSISFPDSEEAVIKVIRQLHGKPITIQGGKTGLTGGSIPLEGHLMQLSHLNHLISSHMNGDGTAVITVEGGMTLSDLRKNIRLSFRKNALFWPPSPSETTATIGGIAATNAKGINACHYGPAENYIEELHFVDADGRLHILNRKSDILPASIIGAEGITGPITQLTLRLLPSPESVWGIAFFFSSENDAEDCAEDWRKLFINFRSSHEPDAWISAMEFLDHTTLTMIEENKSQINAIEMIPAIPDDAAAMLYIEAEGNEEAILDLLDAYMSAVSSHNGNPDNSWAFTGPIEVGHMHDFRHAAPEVCNLQMQKNQIKCPGITKCANDSNLPGLSFADVIKSYKRDIQKSGIPACIFGHIADCHLHVNFLPESMKDYKKAISVLRDWSVHAFSQGGDPAIEHGVGKLKQLFLDSKIIEQKREAFSPVKKLYDPNYCINPGNIFPRERE